MLAGFLVGVFVGGVFGVFVGGVFGVFIMAIMSCARNGDDDNGDEDDEWKTDDR